VPLNCYPIEPNHGERQCSQGEKEPRGYGCGKNLKLNSIISSTHGITVK